MPRAHRTLLVFFLAVGAAALSACSLMFPAAGLRTDGADAAAGSDADAAASPADGNLEAGEAGAWCASAPHLGDGGFVCDDFDEEGPLSRWTGIAVNGSSSLERDRQSFRSFPNSLLASVASGNAFVFRELKGTIRRVRFSFDIKVDARDIVSSYAETNEIRLLRGLGEVSSAFYLAFDAMNAQHTTWVGEAHLADGGLFQHRLALDGNPRFDEWTRVDLEVDLAATPHRMTVHVNGEIAGSDVLEDALYVPGPARVGVGIVYAAVPSSSGWRVRYDNVTLDWE
jgi:hypothetical protein